MPIHVAVAVIEDCDGRVLLTRRPDHVHQGGLWEFPGGKLDPGESVEQALRREIHEELGIDLEGHRPLIRVRHDYGDKAVLLDSHRVTRWSGTPEGREGQPLLWAEKGDLAAYPMPAADRPIINALTLPDRYLIASGETLQDVAQFRRRLEPALIAGVRLVQLRPERQMPLGPLLDAALGLCAKYGADLLLSSRMVSCLPKAVEAGLHLTSRDLMALKSAPDVCGYLAASCHNREELAQAERIGADFALLSPVLPTPSHPEIPAMGWDAFAERVGEVSIPVYALGGVGHLPPEVAWNHGAQGVAGIRGLW
ncbi:MAG: hypothetical protein A2286_07455 [Gammaproteobacteria bacterium RIFOXYA12_FULL_61_12]|nr:MAG: hypothetical protein A2514_12295 [Gammaproteobacteria bacterium RIFOXYD12_FULL_61_37]OGT92035.1 MAG: hypothetical protein A2286_07455 [Gammaproteobacteria bacterium RIFOXYA12_FULL_61_12]